MQIVINGMILGAVYALIALGYTMVYGIMKLINFAHGDVYMLGAFMGYYLIRVWQVNFFLALLVAMIGCALVGVVIERVAYRPLRGATKMTALITAIGVSFLLENVMTYWLGSSPRQFPQAIEVKSYELLGASVTNVQVLILLTALVLLVGLQVIVKATKIGRAMRAVSADRDAARLMGINPDVTISFTFALGSSLAGAAGVLIGLYYGSIDPLMGMAPGLKAFVAAVLGGIGILPGAALGGLLIGLLETSVQSLPEPLAFLAGYKDAVVYVALIMILLIKPAGLLGKHVKEKV